MFDYETLKLVWWGLIGVLLIGFALTDGFDLGAGMLLPFVGRNDTERRVVLNTIAPHWEGNQVWLVTAGGALFAAWPMVYAAAFSGFYWAMLLVLFALFFRPAGLDYRSKLADPRWRRTWDWLLFTGSLVPALVFGVAFGNLLLGVPFELDDTLRSHYSGSFFGLLNPFGLLAGLVSVVMLLSHGAAWLALRADGAVQARAQRWVAWAALAHIALFVAAGVWVCFGLQGYSLVPGQNANHVLNPLSKLVNQDNAGWLANYHDYPLTWLAPVAGAGGSLLALLLARLGRGGSAILGSSLAIVGTILTAGLALFPFILPSSTSPASSLTIWDATSSQRTLGIMLVVAMIMVPTILLYTSWGYWKMRGRIGTRHIEDNTHSAY